MNVIPSFPMPFPTAPCKVWKAVETARDYYGNLNVEYADEPDWEGPCCYSPSRTRWEQTGEDIEEGRPHGASRTLTIYLPKTFSLPMHAARIAVYPDDDPEIYGVYFYVDGVASSHMRRATPGDYSWQVEAVEHVG